MAEFEDEYFYVLQNIEFAIVDVYRHQQSLSDYDVDKILAILVSEYHAEGSNKRARKTILSASQADLYASVHRICEWRLGREAIAGDDQQPQLDEDETVTVAEIVACLKRIRKSVETWNKQGGQRGYLFYIDQFIQ